MYWHPILSEEETEDAMNKNGAFVKTLLIFAGIPAAFWTSIMYLVREEYLSFVLFDWIGLVVFFLQLINVVLLIVALRYYSYVSKNVVKYGRAFMLGFSVSGVFFWGFILSASLTVGEFPRLEELIFELVPAAWLPLVAASALIGIFRKRICVKHPEMVPLETQADILDQHMVGDE